MRQSTRLILNTGATYLRMLVTVGIGLYFTRLVLRSLGEDAFGVWVLLVSTVGWGLVVSDSLVQSADRFLPFEVGRKEPGALRAAFAALVLAFGAAGAGILLLGAALAPWIPAWLNVPIGMRADASWGLAWTAATVALIVWTTPYRSMFVAHQEIVLLSVIEVLDSALRVVAAVVVVASGAPSIRGLSLALLAAQAAVSVIAVGLATWRYEDARASRRDIVRAPLSEIMRFSGWSLLGNLSYRLRSSGVPTILSVFYGPVWTAANSVAMQTAGYLANLAAALSRAARPAIAQAEGGQNAELTRRLALATSKFGAWMVIVPAIPILLETEYLLALWLGEPPAHAATFVRIVCLTFVLPWLTMGHHHAINASGRISLYVIIALACEAAGVGVAAVGAASGRFSTPAVLWSAACGVLAFVSLTVVVMGPRVGIAPRVWTRGVLTPVVASAGPAALVAWLVYRGMEPGALRLGAIISAAGAMFLPAAWAFGLSREERAHFARLGGHLMRRLRLARPATPARADR